MGVEIRFGEFRVKYDSVLDKEYKNLKENKVKPLAKELWEEVFNSVTIELTEAQKNTLRSTYKKSYFDVMKQKVEEMAEEQALLDAPDYFESLLKSE